MSDYRSRRARARVAGRGPSRRGFTLIELMVTIVILTLGLLALAGTSAAVTRQIGGGAQMALAASTAQARFERLRSEDCVTLTGGTATTRGITEVWTASNQPRVVQVTDTVKFTTARGQRSHAYVTLIPCPDL